MRRVLAGTILAALAAAPAFAATTVLDPWNTGDPNDELNLFEIYNDLYGTNFTSTNGATNIGGGGLPGDHSGGMDLLAVDVEVFAGGSGDGMAEFVARYAGYEQRFGYYRADGGTPSGDPTSGTSNGDFEHLFDVTSPGNTVTNLGIGTISLADFPVGFYTNAPLGGSRTWFSEQGLNSDGQDHMVAFWAIEADGSISTERIIIAFEDLRNLGDVDYNDLVVELTIPGRVPPPSQDIPEPATVGLMLMGVAGIALRKRFTA